MMLLPLSLTTSPSFYESFEDVKAHLMPHPLLELSLTELRSPSPLGSRSSFALEIGIWRMAPTYCVGRPSDFFL